MPKQKIPNPAFKYKDLDSSTKHRCEQCPYWSLEKFRLNRHVKVVHQKIKKCSLCDFLSGSNLELKHHLNNEHKNKMVFCMHCSYSTLNRYKPDLAEHIKKVHEQIFDEFCDRCDSSFSSIKDLRKHQKIAHKEGTVFQELPRFKKRAGNYKKMCEKCSYTTLRSSLLKSHLLTVHQLPICLNCSYQGKDFEELRNHCHETHESMYNIDPTTCHLCKFSAHSSLPSANSISKTLIHIMAVHGGKHPCPTCNKNFKQKNYLKEHINKGHLKKFDIHCEKCNQAFWRRKDLETHLRKCHLTRTKNLSCEVCDITFGEESNLKRHMKKKNHVRKYEKSLDVPLTTMKFPIEDDAGPKSTENHENAGKNLCCPVTACLLQFSHINKVNKHLCNDHNLD